MLLASVALAAVLLAGLLLVLVVRSFLAADEAVGAAESTLVRQLAWRDECAQYLASRSRIADGVQAGTGAVQRGSSITRSSHRAIASIPFGILRAIPATRSGSQRVQEVHDGTAEVVYDTIDTVSERIGEAVRRRMVGGAGATDD
jgi:hypothetical protein